MAFGQTKRFCLRGHDTMTYGRNASNQCRECRRVEVRSPRNTNRVYVYDELNFLKVPTAPLRTWMVFRDISLADFRRRDSYQYRAIQRPMMSVALADEIACSFGVHPHEIWHDLWWAADKEGA